jgi:hypothetical protein
MEQDRRAGLNLNNSILHNINYKSM